VTRSRLATFGERGAMVRLIEVRGKDGRYLVQWGEKAHREQRSWPRTVAGKRSAEAFFAAMRDGMERPATRTPLTTRDLWLRFEADRFPTLRPNTKRLYQEAWTRWELFFKPETPPEALTVIQCGEFRRNLEAKQLASTTVGSIIRYVRGVYNWAEQSELIAVNKWHRFTFRVPTGSKPKPRAEYRAEEFVAIWKALDPTKASQWRPWAVIGLLGIYGNRQHAILSMQWEWDCGDEIVIPASVEKTGEESVLPVFPLTRTILDTCKRWRLESGYAGEYVFFPGRKGATRFPHYTIQSLTDALHLAEQRAGIPTIKWRAGHGFRRGLVGDLAESTGDLALALRAIGDEVSMAKHYHVRRDSQQRQMLGDRLTRMLPETTPLGATQGATEPTFLSSDES
jgi:integrase